MVYIGEFNIRNRIKKRYYKVVDCAPKGGKVLMKEYRKILWFYVPCNKSAFWTDKYEARNYKLKSKFIGARR